MKKPKGGKEDTNLAVSFGKVLLKEPKAKVQKSSSSFLGISRDHPAILKNH